MGERSERPVSASVSEYFEDELVTGLSRALEALAEALPGLVGNVPRCLRDDSACRRGVFRPDEEEELLVWFARFLTVRNGLWEILGEVSRPVGGEISRVLNTFGWRCFVLGYSSACLIVRLDQFLVGEIATHKVVQRKLNEGSRRYRIPRKQFTAVFESFTDPRKARLMDQAMRFANRHRSMLDAMGEDFLVGEHAEVLGERETTLDPSRRRYGARLLSYLSHTLRRRGASVRQQTLFSALETSGRLVSELHDRWTPPRISRALQAEIDALLAPGDVLITRHDLAVTNLFLPGYWPHVALYVGSSEDRQRLGIEVDADRDLRWSGDRRVLEALKDGVLYRPLEQTLAVDVVAVIRPKLEVADINMALTRVSVHEGKGYNFDFDFFRSDRLVCTEVVYRAFDGLGGIEIPLQERSGRPTLSAEDLLDLALGGRGFDTIAICGVAGCRDRVATGTEAHHLIAESYSAESRTISST